jgi:plastocyanin
MRRAMYAILALLIVGGAACGADETTAPEASSSNETPVATPSPSSPSATPPEFTTTCIEAKAVDLTGDDPFTFTVHHFKFAPDCFIAKLSASVAIENKDDVGHTWTIDGTLVQAPLPPHQTYTHGPSTGFLEPGAYPFHCSIHPKMTGTMIVL